MWRGAREALLSWRRWRLEPSASARPTLPSVSVVSVGRWRATRRYHDTPSGGAGPISQRPGDPAVGSRGAGYWPPGAAAPRATVEIPVTGKTPVVRALLSSGEFGAAVTTDFPDPGRFIRKTANDLKKFVGAASDEGYVLPEISTTVACRWGAPDSGLHISVQDIFAEKDASKNPFLERAAAGLSLRIFERADAGERALLMCGGDQHTWRNPDPRYPKVFDLLHEAATVLKDYANPPAIWCTANPLSDTPEVEAERLARKLELGASVVVTRPAGLHPERAQRFWDALDRCGLVGTPIIVGQGVPAGVHALQKWIRWCGLPEGDAYARELCQQWESASATGEEAFKQFRQAQLAESMAFAKSLPGVAGVHLHPGDDRGVQCLLDYIDARRRERPGQPVF